ncbi:MAG TPA: protein-L-isoaspartate O-methyltransferase, partial [Bacteroidales bacterium]|nr:protein-L-isoaspartate O-methyltransferase [Bacteroidales bacterium]
DGYKGKPQYGPYDSILITAAIREIPEALLEQIKTRGCLVAPVGGSHSQVMTRIYKNEKGEFEETHHGLFVFVPMLGGTVNDK